MFDDEMKEPEGTEEDWSPSFGKKGADEDTVLFEADDADDDSGGRWGDDDMEAEGEE